jgi:hypothetical protein
MYINEVRLMAIVLGAAMVVLGIGVLLSVAGTPDQMQTVDVFLGVGVFFLLFTLLVFVPRLRSRGATSYSLLVEYAMDEVESAVTSAIADTGRKARVTPRKSRFARPPREVAIDGVPWTFALRAAPYRERKEDGTKWTEIVQKGFSGEGDDVARELRERILARLATSVA